jgi:hypothetical protein
MRAKRLLIVTIVSIVLVSGGAATAIAPVGTVFTYQGQLKISGEPAVEATDFEFKLWDAEVDGTELGVVAVTVPADEMVNGMFSVPLDFGALAFTGEARWLEVWVRYPPSVDFVPFEGRQEITPAPYALYALDGPSDSLWESNGSDVYYLDGNVGIGTTSPLAALQVKPPGHGYSIGLDSLHQDDLVVEDDRAILGLYSFWEDEQQYGSGIALGQYNDGGEFIDKWGMVRRLDWDPNPDRAGLRFTYGANPDPHANPTVMYLDRMGMVGIGTTNPNGPLHVESGVNINAGSNFADRVAPVAVGDADGPGAALLIDGNQIEQANEDDRLYINMNSPADLSLNYGGGNVGIGTTGPDVRLHVDGGTDVTPAGGGYAMLGSPTGQNLAIDINEIMARDNGAPSRLSLNAAGGDVLIANAGPGNVGIGTADPGAKLEVVGPEDTDLLMFEVDGHDRFSITTHASGPDYLSIRSKFENPGAAIATFRGSGNVGIGITNPQAKLHVAGTSGVDGIMFPDGTLQTTAGGGSGGVGGGGIAGYVTKFVDSTTIANSPIYDDNGDIGIGTTDPGGKLHVHGGPSGGSAWNGTYDFVFENDNSSVLNLVAPTDKESAISFSDTARSCGAIRYDHATDGMNFRTAGVDGRIYIDSDGDVGIGQTNPGARLDVVTTAGQPALKATNESGSVAQLGTTAEGVYGENTSSVSGHHIYGVHGYSSGNFGTNYGVYGASASAIGGSAYGVYGKNQDSENYGYLGGDNHGVYGWTDGDESEAGRFEATGLLAMGVSGIATGTEGIGVYGSGRVGARFLGTEPDGAGIVASGGATGLAAVFTGKPGATTDTTVRINAPIAAETDAILEFSEAGEAKYRIAFDTQWPQHVRGLKFFMGETKVLHLDAHGYTKVRVLEIQGADLAEKFPVSEQAKPGMVMEIDPYNPGELRLARGAYNRRVAGVVSGANGLSVGAVLGNMEGMEEAPPIALSGRVWVHCDAASGAIEPGDLLTTSETPGHAMKVTDHAKAQGAIIGKAMTALSEGKGLILVLVSLQ